MKPKHEQWIKEGKKVWVVTLDIEGHKKPAIALTYGDNEKEAIENTMLYNPKNITIKSLEINLFDGIIPDGNFIGWVK